MGIYRGWHMVAIGMLALMLAVASAIHSYSLYVLPVSAEFGLSRADFNTGLILINFGMAISAPVIGRQLDRRSIRLVMAISAIMLGGSLVVLGLSSNLWLSAAMLAIPLAGAVVGTGTLSSTTLVARWFTAYRGRAMAIATIGISLGPVVVVPLIGLLLETLDWRRSLIVTGCAVGVLLLALVPFVRDRPGPDDSETSSADAALDAASAQPQASGGPITLSTLMKAQPFWTITIGSGLCFGVHQTLIVSLAPIAQEQGLSIATSASLLSLFGVAAIAGKLLLAWRGDRVDRLLLLVILFGLTPAANVALMFGHGYGALLGCAALLGLLTGATAPTFLALLADRFGTASYGTVSGAASFISTMLGAAALRFGGEVFDRTGSYRFMFISFVVISAVSALLVWWTKPVVRPPSAAERQSFVS